MHRREEGPPPFRNHLHWCLISRNGASARILPRAPTRPCAQMPPRAQGYPCRTTSPRPLQTALPLARENTCARNRRRLETPPPRDEPHAAQENRATRGPVSRQDCRKRSASSSLFSSVAQVQRHSKHAHEIRQNPVALRPRQFIHQTVRRPHEFTQARELRVHRPRLRAFQRS